eukprot:10757710-Karenia_brevis.AAC.1
MVRAGFCMSWSRLWDVLKKNPARRLWQTYRQFTSIKIAQSCPDPDSQWVHWSTQNLETREHWTHEVHSEAAEFVSHLRSLPLEM